MNDTERAAKGLPMWKPVKGQRRIDGYTRKMARAIAKAREKNATRRDELAADKEIRWYCFNRDHQRCRALGVPLLFQTDNPLKRAENHHIVFRSAGGSDKPTNRITLSPQAHRMVHEGYLDIEGNAEKLVLFRQYTYGGGTRSVLKVWRG